MSDHLCRFLIDQPVAGIVRVFDIAEGSLTEMLAAGSFLSEHRTNFLGGISGIPFVEKIADCGKTLVVAVCAVNAVSNGNKAYIVAGEDNVCVLSDGQIVTTEA